LISRPSRSPNEDASADILLPVVAVGRVVFSNLTLLLAPSEPVFGTVDVCAAWPEMVRLAGGAGGCGGGSCNTAGSSKSALLLTFGLIVPARIFGGGREAKSDVSWAFLVFREGACGGSQGFKAGAGMEPASEPSSFQSPWVIGMRMARKLVP